MSAAKARARKPEEPAAFDPAPAEGYDLRNIYIIARTTPTNDADPQAITADTLAEALDLWTRITWREPSHPPGRAIYGYNIVRAALANVGVEPGAVADVDAFLSLALNYLGARVEMEAMTPEARRGRFGWRFTPREALPPGGGPTR